MQDQKVGADGDAEQATGQGAGQVAGQVAATPAARALLDEIRAEAGAVLFHVSGGCCDGTVPMCYPCGEFRLGAGDRRLGSVDGAEIWVSAAQAPLWDGVVLTLDAAPGRGGAFSLDNGRGQRFIARGDLCRR